jgi:UDP-2-acetamido-2-deoxy-ribo-hexuluronate aminotransferase
MIPQLDLKAEYESIKEEIQKSIHAVLESGSYVLGNKGKQIEKALAEYVGTSYGIGVANGTDALLLSLEAMSIGREDEVITTPFTFFSTAEVIARAGAKPVFVDIDPITYNMNPALIEQAITKKTKAIIVVHLFGQSSDMEKIMQIAKNNDLKIIEDACQSIGATFKGKKVGSFGETGCFSFFPTKNLGTYGDGGMVVTSDKDLYEKICALRNHGSLTKYVHFDIGLNSRLDEIQAAILQVKLKRLDGWNQKRREIANRYSEKLMGLVKTPDVTNDREHVFHQYSIEIEDRDELASYLYQRKIATGIYYPLPLHLQIAFHGLHYQKGDFPIAENVSKKILALPLYPMLKECEQDFVISSIKEFKGDRNGIN